MLDRVTGAELTESYVGKLMKKSKIKFEWEFSIAGQTNKVVLTVSSFSRKYSIFLNGNNIQNGRELVSEVKYNFTISNYKFSICSNYKTANLKINGIDFNKIVEMKSKKPSEEKKTKTNLMIESTITLADSKYQNSVLDKGIIIFIFNIFLIKNR